MPPKVLKVEAFSAEVDVLTAFDSIENKTNIDNYFHSAFLQLKVTAYDNKVNCHRSSLQRENLLLETKIFYLLFLFQQVIGEEHWCNSTNFHQNDTTVEITNLKDNTFYYLRAIINDKQGIILDENLPKINFTTNKCNQNSKHLKYISNH
jgi:hypothetical protein